MTDTTSLDHILAEIRRVDLSARSSADDIRHRVAPLLDSDDAALFVESVVRRGLRVIGEYDDREAAFQATLLLLLESTAILQAVSRRLHEKPSEDAPAALALGAYALADRVLRNRQALIDSIVDWVAPA